MESTITKMKTENVAGMRDRFHNNGQEVRLQSTGNFVLVGANGSGKKGKRSWLGRANRIV